MRSFVGCCSLSPSFSLYRSFSLCRFFALFTLSTFCVSSLNLPNANVMAHGKCICLGSKLLFISPRSLHHFFPSRCIDTRDCKLTTPLLLRLVSVSYTHMIDHSPQIDRFEAVRTKPRSKITKCLSAPLICLTAHQRCLFGLGECECVCA